MNRRPTWEEFSGLLQKAVSAALYPSWSRQKMEDTIYRTGLDPRPDHVRDREELMRLLKKHIAIEKDYYHCANARALLHACQYHWQAD